MANLIGQEMALWLGQAAEAATGTTISFECELPNGWLMVTEEWPSRAAYQKFTEFRSTLETMRKTARSDNQGNRWN